MSEERRKTNKPSTGTVPKIKHRNNFSTSAIKEKSPRCVANNVALQAGFWQQPPYSSQFIRNTRRNTRNNYFTMDAALEEPSTSLPNPPVNGVLSTGSASNSRRNSTNSGLKCDNMTKYPDKKQIEDKLLQIQEYLKVTNSLMANMKSSGDQNDELKDLEKMAKDLKDSEEKLIKILDQINSNDGEEEKETTQNYENGIDSLSEHSSSSNRRNDLDVNLDSQNHDLETLKHQQMALMQLQRTAEQKLRHARQLQSNLMNAQFGNESSNSGNMKESNSYSHFDKAIKELEERAKQIRRVPANQQNVQDNLMEKLETLHDQIMGVHEANEEREELIQVLDNRDAELRTQHAELQNKLVELQNKKMQVDELVVQLQSFGEEEDEDIGGQVKKIVTMKDQLNKLKDMLEIVKTTENLMQNTNASPEMQAAAFEICATTENFLDKENQKPRINTCVQNESNILRYDNDTSSVEAVPKQLNKNTRRQAARDTNPNMSSINHRLAMQTELESKKRELEEIMGKHKASTSNLNHDVGTDNKSEFSCTSNTINEAWLPLIPQQHQMDSDRFSSDEGQDEVNDFQEVNDNHNILILSNLNASPSNTTKRCTENVQQPQYIQQIDFERPHSMSRTPERNARSSSVATSSCIRDQLRSNNDLETRTQVQKQLQLIKSVCDSMLEQQQQQQQSVTSQNLQQLRNNLTPSPLYSEPRRHATPSLNTVNVANPTMDVPWFPYHGNNDLNNYNGWLATNTIQTQSFMLNTLNQCCQMLWLQQRELVSLRNTVSLLQERVENQYGGGPQDQISSPLQASQQPSRSNHFRPQPKVNLVASAFSMPNLNQYNGAPPAGNVDPHNYINHNNLHGNRLLDPCLNNVNINHNGEHPTNNMLHGVNTAAINHAMPNQMWNGQALNNQVAPGNRANNYWDNFRSYSRQNLLSTKNTDPHHQQHPSLERTNPFTLMTFSKSNSEQDSTSTSQENTPQRRGIFRHENVIPPPDVLNINHNVSKDNEQQPQQDVATNQQHVNNEDMNLGLMLLNLNAYNDNSSNHSNISEEPVFKECVPEHCRRRNEWNEEVPDEQQPTKSKLFEELRENVYKEVVSLISANESRPHFLIQLFRDLQMIGSDSLRLKILQSIQMIITHSLLHSNNSKRLSLESQQTTSEQDLSLIPDNLPQQQPTIWAKSTKSSSSSKVGDLSEFQNMFKGAVAFLNEHDDEVFQAALLISLKQVLLNSATLKETVKDTPFHKHFSNILDEVFEQFRGKKVRDIKVHLLQTLNELLFGDIGFIQFIHEVNSEKCISRLSNDIEHENTNYNTSMNGYDQKDASSSQVLNNIQNGDLAEADQTRILDEDIEEEEGAVGGILDTTLQNTESSLINQEDVDLTLNLLELATCGEGLDQIPTRLPTKSKSRSGTPSKDRSNSHTDPDPF